VIQKTISNILLILIPVFILPGPAFGSPFANIIKDKIRIMIVIKDAGNAGDFVGFAENLLKKGFKTKGAAIFNPEMMKKVKEDKLLWQAIQNGSATAMAKITTDYGAVILVRGVLSVDTRQKFAASWEGTASLSLTAVDTKTAEEIFNVNSAPFGTTQNPAPIEDSPLIAKQEAARKVCEDVLVKAGILKGTSDISGVKTIRFELYDVFDLKGKPSTLAFSTDGKYLFSAIDQTVQKWNLQERRMIDTITTGSGTPLSISVSPDNRKLAVGDSEGYLHIWDMGQHKKTLTLETDAGAISSIAFNPDLGSIAIAGDEENIFILSLITGKVTAELEGHEEPINSLAFTPNGRHIVSASSDLSIRWWDVNTQKEKKALTESTDKLLCMALSDDGELAALSIVDVLIDLMRNRRTDERHIKIRNTVTGEEIRSLDGHEKDITTLDFHPDKRFLASGSIDDTVRIWDIQKGEMVTLLELNEDLISVRFSDDGKWFAALSADNKLAVWKLR
jgi:WD40 repeat protein